MPKRKLKVPPTRVNAAYIHGPIFHWDRITDEEARRLGITTLPEKPGSSINEGGTKVRRLKDGALNVAIESTSPLVRDVDFEEFVRVLLDPVPRGDAETRPSDLADLELDIERNGSRQVGVWTWDIDRNVIVRDEEVCRLHGQPYTEHGPNVDQYIANCVHPEDVPRFVELLRITLSSSSPTYDIVYRVNAADGGTRRLRAHAAVERDASGRAIRMSGVFTAEDDEHARQPVRSETQIGPVMAATASVLLSKVALTKLVPVIILL